MPRVVLLLGLVAKVTGALAVVGWSDRGVVVAAADVVVEGGTMRAAAARLTCLAASMGTGRATSALSARTGADLR